jgi:hypothetical protein
LSRTSAPIFCSVVDEWPSEERVLAERFEREAVEEPDKFPPPVAFFSGMK